MPYFPPPPTLPPKVGPFRRVPPAVFPAVLGLLGLVMAWKTGVRIFPVPSAPVEIAEGMVFLLFLFFVVAYGVKLVLRPGAVVEDLNTLPGRTGLAAMALGFLVLATLFSPRNRFDGPMGSAAVSATCLSIGAGLLLAIALYVGFHRLRGTDQAGPPTPAMHLVFAGFVLIPGSALPLGVSLTWIEALSLYCLIAAVCVSVLTIKSLVTLEGAPPLRPLQAIQLAPPAFLATTFVMTGHSIFAALSLVWATSVALLLLFRLRWLTEGGFSGFWSAFTFPATAFAGALLHQGQLSGNEAAPVAGGLVLIATTLYVPVIAYRILKLWAAGTLAVKTNASIA